MDILLSFGGRGGGVSKNNFPLILQKFPSGKWDRLCTAILSVALSAGGLQKAHLTFAKAGLAFVIRRVIFFLIFLQKCMRWQNSLDQTQVWKVW